MGRFDPREGESYGSCKTCGLTLATGEEAESHRAATYEASSNGRSHTTIGSNPDRTARIQSHVDDIVTDAIAEALDKLQDDINRGDLSVDEVTEAINWYSDFAGEWEKN